MTNGSAEIFEFDGERARRTGEVAPENFISVGAYLEAAREAAGLTVAEISEKTHIKAQYLEAIEANDFEALPSKPFAIGFVRGFAEALGLDAAPVVYRYKEEAGYKAIDTERVEEAVAPPAHDDGEVREHPHMSFLGVAAVVAFMIWCAWQLTAPREIGEPFDLSGLPGALSEPPAVSVEAPGAGSGAPSDYTPPVVLAPVEIVDPVLVERIEPVYPPNCQNGAADVETVTAAFTISAAGTVVKERIAEASNACFERAALNALRRWRYEPLTVDGVARPAYERQVTLRFEKP